jgi:uncharacterized C2H2 Zn-finger protein
MGYKCGNCNIDFSNRKDWLDHLDQVHDSHFVEGDEMNIKYHEQILVAKAQKGNSSATQKLEHISINRGN